MRLVAQPQSADIFEIRQALHAYAGGIDTKDYELFRSAFTDDVYSTYGFWCGPFENLEQLATFMERNHRELAFSAHSVSNTYFLEFDGSTARLRSYVDAILVRTDHPEGELFNAFGTYIDELRRTPNGWRLSRREYRHGYHTGNPNVQAIEESNQAVADLETSQQDGT